MLKQFIENLPKNQLWAIADLYNWYNAEYPGLSCRKFTRQLCGMTSCKLQHPRIDGKQTASIYLPDGELKDPPLPPDTRFGRISAPDVKNPNNSRILLAIR